MRILLVSHRYPPAHRAGTELYGARLAAGLRERGHEVRVICAEKEISAVDHSVRRREHDGVQVTEIVNNLQYESFRETWDSPKIAARFDEVLEGFLSEGWRPDACHFQHFMYLGVGCVEACAKRALPVLLTLHDYWLQCARMGQRRHADESLCDTLDAQRCGGCLVDFKWRQSPLETRVGTAIAKLRQVTGVDLGPLATGAARRSSSTQATSSGTELVEELPEARVLTREVDMRDAELRSRLRKAVSLFTSPSAFLKERFIEWGIPPEEILHLPTGIDFAATAGERRPATTPLDLLFLGSYIPAKGAHVLLEAWGKLPLELRTKGKLRLHGPDLDPAYTGALRGRAKELLNAEVGDSLSPIDVIARLGRADLLIVPSLWWENAPLVLLEAARAGTPVLCSDAGAMRDFVREGENGMRFPLGDAAALAERLAEVLADPQRLDALEPGALSVPTVAEWTSSFEILYESLTESADPE